MSAIQGGVSTAGTEKKEIPGPSGHPILGSLREIQQDRLGFLLSNARRYGPVVKFRVGPATMYQINSPDGVQHVLQANNHNYNKESIGFDGLRDLMGDGLLLSDGDFWLKQRRLMQPAFHRQKIKHFGDMIVEEAEKMLQAWGGYAASGQPVDVSREMMRLTLSVITRALFSDRVDDDSGAIGEAVTILLEDSIYRFDHPFAMPRWFPTNRNRRYATAKRDLHAVIDGIVKRRRDSSNGHNDLLDMLMQARDEDSGEGMSDTQLRKEMITLFTAGHETTALLLGWSLYLLAQNPEARERLGEELEGVLGGRLPAESDIPNLTYTRMVLDETMRLYPPAWLTNRKSLDADEIEGYVIPAGAEVAVIPYVTHRDPALWPEPEKFDPQRFTPEKTAERHRYAFFPFGAGPRLCIGNNFAILEAQLILASICQRYAPELAPGHKVEPEALITLRPKDGLWMHIRPV